MPFSNNNNNNIGGDTSSDEDSVPNLVDPSLESVEDSCIESDNSENKDEGISLCIVCVVLLEFVFILV